MNHNRNVKITYEILSHNNELKGIIFGDGGNINVDSKAEIKRSASLRFHENKGINVNFITDKIRPMYELNGEKFCLGTYIISNPEVFKVNKSKSRTIECYDILQILAEDKLTYPLFIKENTLYTEAVLRIIRSSNILDYKIEESNLRLERSREFEIGESKLSVINTLLKEINYDLKTNVWGTLLINKYLPPYLKNIDFKYSEGENILLNSSSVKTDMFDLPNVIVGVSSNVETNPLRFELVNDNPKSIISTVNRKRKIVKVSNYSDVANIEVLEHLVRREMNSIVSGSEVYTFQSPISPAHEIENMLFIEDKTLNVFGKYLETSWSIDLRIGGTMTHTCERVINL